MKPDRLQLDRRTKPRSSPTFRERTEVSVRRRGIVIRGRGVRGPKSAPVEGEHELFGFLTTEANAIVAPIHPKAMPVILTTTEEFDLWLEGERGAETAAALAGWHAGHCGAGREG